MRAVGSGVASGAVRRDAFLVSFGHSKRWRGAGAGEARTHGASGGRGDASTAAGAGACSGAFVGRCGGAWPGIGRRLSRFLCPLDTRNAGAERRRGRPAPMARAVGAGTRPPRRERAHATGLLPTGTSSMAQRGQLRGAARRVSCSRLLNQSRFPDGRAHGFAAPLRVALGLRPKCPQGTRFPARLSGARNARVACVRRKDGRCHSERSKGRDPLT